MNRSVILSLLISSFLLAGCYRQAGDTFQQVDSQSVESIESPTAVIVATQAETTEEASVPALDAVSSTGDSSVQPSKTPDPLDPDPVDELSTATSLPIPTANNPALLATATPIEIPVTPTFVTPESAPGQTTPPTINPPTATATFEIVQATATTLSDAVEAGDECVREVVRGDTLFRIAINNGTTVEAIQQLNGLESDNIQIGQLLRIPGCVAGQADAPEEPTTNNTTTIRPTATSSVGGSSVATLESNTNLPSAGQQIHVVISGETLGGIANRYNVSISELIELNNLSDPNALQVGDELIIPASN